MRNSPDVDFIELRFVIDWREHEQMLKLEVPTAMVAPARLCQGSGSVIERPLNGDERPYQDWAAVEGKVGGADYTLAVLNDAQLQL